MAADLIVKISDLDGMNPDAIAYVNCDVGGDQFVNDGFTLIHIDNGATQETTVIFHTQHNCNHGYEHDEGCAVPVSKQRMFGPFDPGRFNDAYGKVNITYTGGITLCKIAAIRIK